MRLRTAKTLALISIQILGAKTLPAQVTPPYFIPISPSLFWNGTNAGASNGYFGEWHLQNNMPVIQGTNAGYDVNIMGAWSNGFTGQGITIAIVDDGVLGAHSDLQFANDLSWDFKRSIAENLTDPKHLGYPKSTNDTHGTACAGVAAGYGYGIGIVGAAPDARIASHRILSDRDSSGQPPASNAIAFLTYQGQRDAAGRPNPYLPVRWNNPSWTNGAPIRVKSHSYSMGGSGYDLTYDDIQGAKIMSSLASCESNGVINVFSSGNERIGTANQQGTFDSNRKQIQSTPNIIVAGALSSAGTNASYSSFGANLFVTAPSDDPFLPGRYSIPTTDLLGPIGDNWLGASNSYSNHYEKYFRSGRSIHYSELLNYNSTFGGTSSACPLVAGIMAIGIQADPFLTTRMAQHLLALTSRQIDPTDTSVGGWITNAAGYRFNNNYGFGLIDATAFTAAAAFVYDYQIAGGAPLSQQRTNFVSKTFTNALFAENDAQSNGNVINVAFTLNNKWTNLPIEYVQVTLQITGFETNMANYSNGTGAIAGDISGQLISPQGTTNMLFYTDRILPLNKRSVLNYVDKKGSVHLLWTYLSNAYYGEDPSGTWRLVLQNNSTNRTYTKNLRLDFANLTVGVGDFDRRCLGDFPFANGTNQSLLPSLGRGWQSVMTRNQPLTYTPGSNSLFWSGTNAGAGSNYYGQWQLQNQMPIMADVNAGLDVNIAGAWSNGFTGRGVTIAVVDGGVQGNHPDLNYSADYSWNFTLSKENNQTNRFRGYPTGLLNTHGTACAGVAAGIGNGIGVVGAAPEAMVSSFVFQTDGTPQPQKNLPGSLGLSYLYQGQKDSKGRPDAYAPVNWNDPKWTNGAPIRIHSRSLGNSGSGYNTGDVQLSDYMALRTATDHGVIVVNSSGNDRPIIPGSPNGLATQDANRSKILTAPESIIVGALSSDGLFAYYSSYGCNLFVTAPSSSGNSNNYLIPTTDLIGRLGNNSLLTNVGSQELFLTNALSYRLFDYTSMFGGTSSSCPLVAGIMAMGVQANPLLNTRTAQHLLALTSRQIDEGDDSVEGRWKTNAAGYRYNNNYGFGLIDASAFTTAAAYTYYNQLIGGTPLSPQQTNSATVNLKNSYFVLGTNRTNTLQTSVALTNKSPGLPVEYVHVRLNISGFETNGQAYLSGKGSIPGDISGYLVSPSGTTNQLFTADRNLPDLSKRSWRPTSIDKKKGGILDWTYLSYAYYGENPSGTWKLVLRNESTSSAYSKNLQVNSVTITTGVGSFDTNCLGDFPFANGTSRITP